MIGELLLKHIYVKENYYEICLLGFFLYVVDAADISRQGVTILAQYADDTTIWTRDQKNTGSTGRYSGIVSDIKNI